MGFVSGALIGFGGALIGIWVTDTLKQCHAKVWVSEVVGWAVTGIYIAGTILALRAGY